MGGDKPLGTVPGGFDVGGASGVIESVSPQFISLFPDLVDISKFFGFTAGDNGIHAPIVELIDAIQEKQEEAERKSYSKYNKKSTHDTIYETEVFVNDGSVGGAISKGSAQAEYDKGDLIMQEKTSGNKIDSTQTKIKEIVDVQSKQQ